MFATQVITQTNTPSGDHTSHGTVSQTVRYIINTITRPAAH